MAMNIHSRRIEGVEALIRWRDPSSGLVAPGTFLPLLESTGLIVEVGNWVLEQAARDSQQWQRLGLPTIRVAVNVSTIQLRRPDFADRFLQVLAPWADSARGLDIEITEGALFDDCAAEVQKLQRLRAAGVRVAIDDFGTGYSSLSRLSDLPIDTLKIDRSFVSRLPDDSLGRTLVATIISLPSPWPAPSIMSPPTQYFAPTQATVLPHAFHLQSLASRPLPARRRAGLLHCPAARRARRHQ